MARITIGMPLYNNAKTVEVAISSLLAQTFTDFVLLISDDGSTDATPEICRAFAARDPRVLYHRQPVNLNYGNFRYLVQQAATDYFMWAAGDDWWEPTLLERELALLEARRDAVCCVSRVLFHKNGVPVKDSPATASLEGDVATNILRYILNIDDNSRMYGLFRTEIARKAFPAANFHAYDWAFSAATLLYGKHLEIPETLIWRDYTEAETYNFHVRKDNTSLFFRLFPVLKLSWYLVFTEKIPINLRIVVALIALNIQMHLNYVRFFHPTYWKIIWPAAWVWRRHIAWRFKEAARSP